MSRVFDGRCDVFRCHLLDSRLDRLCRAEGLLACIWVGLRFVSRASRARLLSYAVLVFLIFLLSPMLWIAIVSITYDHLRWRSFPSFCRPSPSCVSLLLAHPVVNQQASILVGCALTSSSGHSMSQTCRRSYVAFEVATSTYQFAPRSLCRATSSQTPVVVLTDRACALTVVEGCRGAAQQYTPPALAHVHYPHCRHTMPNALVVGWPRESPMGGSQDQQQAFDASSTWVGNYSTAGDCIVCTETRRSDCPQPAQASLLFPSLVPPPPPRIHRPPKLKNRKE